MPSYQRISLHPHVTLFDVTLFRDIKRTSQIIHIVFVADGISLRQHLEPLQHFSPHSIRMV